MSDKWFEIALSKGLAEKNQTIAKLQLRIIELEKENDRLNDIEFCQHHVDLYAENEILKKELADWKMDGNMAILEKQNEIEELKKQLQELPKKICNEITLQLKGCATCKDFLLFNSDATDSVETELTEDDLTPVIELKVGNYYLEKYNQRHYIYQYLGDKKFKCLSHHQGYHIDSVILGGIICGEDNICLISKDEAEARVREIKGEK